MTHWLHKHRDPLLTLLVVVVVMAAFWAVLLLVPYQGMTSPMQ